MGTFIAVAIALLCTPGTWILSGGALIAALVGRNTTTTTNTQEETC